MTCSEIRDLLGNYMDEESSDRMMQRVEKHLLRCPACAYEARSLEQARQLLRRGVERPMVSDALGERVLQQVAERFVHLRPHSSEEALTLPLSTLESETPAES